MRDAVLNIYVADAAEMKDTKKYGTDSAEQFLDLAVEIGKENFKREWATDGQP